MTSPIELQHHAVSAAELGWRDEWPSDLQVSPGERIVAFCDGAVVAEAIVHRVPDDTVSIVFTDPYLSGVDNSEARGVGAVLCSAVEIADQLQSRYAYVFFDAECSSGVRNELAATGFRRVDCILEMTRGRDGWTVDSADCGDCEFFASTADELTTKCSDGTMPFSKAAFDSLLQNIIRESHDLKELPPPTPARLRKMWTLLDADVAITVACLRKTPVAMAVLSQAAFNESNPVIVEYFGVHSEFRRRGIGRNLLRMAIAGGSTRDVLVSSFVAEKNAAAKAFFGGCGFQEQTGRELWVYEPSA